MAHSFDISRNAFENESYTNVRSSYIGNKTCLCWTANRFKMYVPSDDISLAPHIIINGYWESWISVCFLRFLDYAKPKSVINVGANIGYYSLLASSFNNEIEVIAFEPQPRLASLITRSSIVNGFGNLMVKTLAAGSENKKIWLNTFGDYFGSATAINKDEDKGQGFEIDCITLDSVSSDPIEFMIIDAEGFEYDVLIGAQNRLEKSVTSIIFLEFSSTRYKNKIDFVDWILKMNFSIFKIDHFGYIAPIDHNTLLESNVTLDIVITKGIPSGFII